jgi:hypothetical protein
MTTIPQIGFWDYTAPGGGGGLETYSRADYDALLDDMVAGGFNSLVLGIKWLSTGYRSKHPWLDQDPNCTAIASDNALIHHALRGARERGIKTWLLVVGTQYKSAQFGLTPTGHWNDVGIYDLDCPGLVERIEALFTEIAELFGAETDGIVAEIEFCDGEAPHRIPLYDAWAAANSRPDFASIKQIRLEPRSYPFAHWRDFTTHQRCIVFNRIESVVRKAGFAGKLSALIELENSPMALLGNTNIEALKNGLPNWGVTTYDSIYDRTRHRLATMDFCIETPRAVGFEVAWLTRGVMTFGESWSDKVMSLPDQWRMSLEDARDHRPDILWFMGSDARVDGPVSSNKKLPAWGYPDGLTARKELMKMTRRIL